MPDESSQQLTQPRTFRSGQRFAQAIHHLRGGIGGRIEPVAAGVGEVDEIAAPIVRIAATFGQPLTFELVDDVHHRRLVELQSIHQRPLIHRAGLGERGQHAQMSQFDPVFAQRSIGRGPRVAMRQIQLTADSGTEPFRGFPHPTIMTDDRSSEFR